MRTSSLSIISLGSRSPSPRLPSFSFLSKTVSFRSSSLLQDSVALARDPAATPDEKRKAIRTIREVSDKIEPMALVRLGVPDIMLEVIEQGSDDERMWAIYVLLKLVSEPETTTWILEKSEHDAISILSTLLVTKFQWRNNHQSTIVIERLLQLFSTMVKQEMCLGLLTRPEVMHALEAGLRFGTPEEACMALKAYHTMVYAIEPVFLLSLASKDCIEILEVIASSSKVSAADKALARECVLFFETALATYPPEERMAHEPDSREPRMKWSQFLLETFEGHGPVADKLLEEALRHRDSTRR